MRIESLKNALKKTDADAYLVSDLKNIHYFTGFRDTSEAMLTLLVSFGDATLLVSPLSMTAATENVKNCRIRGISSGEMPTDALINMIQNVSLEFILRVLVD